MSDIYTDLYMDSYNYNPPASSINKIQSIFAFHINNQNFVADLTSFSLESKPLPADRVTFGRYTAGRAVEWKLKISSVFDGGSQGSLHDFLWNYSGYTTEFILRPFADFDPLTKRYYRGQIRIPYKPDIKVKAGDVSTWDYEFKVIGHPTRSDKALGMMTGSYINEY